MIYLYVSLELVMIYYLNINFLNDICDISRDHFVNDVLRLLKLFSAWSNHHEPSTAPPPRPNTVTSSSNKSKMAAAMMPSAATGERRDATLNE